MTINLLPPEVASQIAAGEVVERPASVVKELIENSLDAGAHRVSIDVQGAGQRLIEVADDGDGIPPEEISKALARHATSKLSSAEELFKIHTLGFRGEALAAIGSVSHMTITSCPDNTAVGATISVDGGLTGKTKPVGASKGTIVRVEDLFYNIPARRKFLKSEVTERRHIDKTVTNYALAYPEVSFQLKQGGKDTFQTSGNGNRREVLASLMGVEVGQQMLEVVSDVDQISITGFISPPTLTRSNRRAITLFVNGRPVRNAAINKAVVQAYHTLLMVGRYPLAVLFLKIPPEDVDVNVHPTKAEVRFRKSGVMYKNVQHAVRRALNAHMPIPDLNEAVRWGQSAWTSAQSTVFSKWDSARDDESKTGTSLDQDDQEVSMPGGVHQQSGKQAGFSGVPGGLLKLVGQVAKTYLVAEGPDGLYLIDQHAAHERVLFEEFMNLRNRELDDEEGENPIHSQVLMKPTTVEFSPDNWRLVNERLPILNKLGFNVEPFGRSTFLVRALPSLLSNMAAEAALRVLVDDFEEDERPLQSEIEAQVIARVCKRGAIKAGQTLSIEEQSALLSDLEACQSPRTCPHGRPTMIHLSVDILERQFGRRGSR